TGDVQLAREGATLVAGSARDRMPATGTIAAALGARVVAQASSLVGWSPGFSRLKPGLQPQTVPPPACAVGQNLVGQPPLLIMGSLQRVPTVLCTQARGGRVWGDAVAQDDARWAARNGGCGAGFGIVSRQPDLLGPGANPGRMVCSERHQLYTAYTFSTSSAERLRSFTAILPFLGGSNGMLLAPNSFDHSASSISARSAHISFSCG